MVPRSLKALKRAIRALWTSLMGSHIKGHPQAWHLPSFAFLRFVYLPAFWTMFLIGIYSHEQFVYVTNDPISSTCYQWPLIILHVRAFGQNNSSVSHCVNKSWCIATVYIKIFWSVLINMTTHHQQIQWHWKVTSIFLIVFFILLTYSLPTHFLNCKPQSFCPVVTLRLAFCMPCTN